MAAHSHTYDADDEVTFDAFDALLGVMIDPGATMRHIAIHQPWLFAMVLAIGINVVNWIAAIAPLLAVQREVVPYLVQREVDFLYYLIESPWPILAVAILTPITLAIAAGYYFAIGTIFGADINFRGLMATLPYAQLPLLISAPLIAFINIAAAKDIGAQLLVSAVFGFWSLYLSIIAIKESFRISFLVAFFIYFSPYILLGAAGYAVFVVILRSSLRAIGLD